MLGGTSVHPVLVDLAFCFSQSTSFLSLSFSPPSPFIWTPYHTRANYLRFIVMTYIHPKLIRKEKYLAASSQASQAKAKISGVRSTFETEVSNLAASARLH